MRTRVLDFRSNEGKDFRSNESFRRNGSNHPLPLVITDHCSFHMISLPLDWSIRKKGFWDRDQIKTHSSYTPRCQACSEVASHPNQSCKDNLVFAWLVNHFIFLFGFCFNLTLAPILFALLSVFVHPFPMQKKTSKKMRHLGFSYIWEKRHLMKTDLAGFCATAPAATRARRLKLFIIWKREDTEKTFFISLICDKCWCNLWSEKSIDSVYNFQRFTNINKFRLFCHRGCVASEE